MNFHRYSLQCARAGVIAAIGFLSACSGSEDDSVDMRSIGTVEQAVHSWGSYHWARAANPLALNVGDNVGSAWDAYLNEAISDWNPSEVLELTKIPGPYTTSSKIKTCRPTAGRIEVCNAKYGFLGWLGIAQIWASGDHITQGTAKMNDSYFNTATYNTPAWRRMVMCQEIAHDFGLDHQDEIHDNPNLGSCMDYTNDPDGPLSNEHPNAHDFEQLALIYEHVEGAAASSSGSPGGSGLGSQVNTGSGPENVGEPVAQDGQGRPHVFVRNLGNGNTVITHVLWAL